MEELDVVPFQTSEGRGDGGEAGSGNRQDRQATRSHLSTAKSRSWRLPNDVVSLGVSVCWDDTVGARSFGVVQKLRELREATGVTPFVVTFQTSKIHVPGRNVHMSVQVKPHNVKAAVLGGAQG